MRTTKNVTIKEDNRGFAINNNYATICVVGNYVEAKKIAIAIAKKENKGAVANTDFYHEVLQ